MLRFLDQFRRIIFFASIVGLTVGFAESLTDLVSGSVIDSRWARGNIEFAATTKFLYIAFNAALYMVFFQLVGAVASVINIKKTEGGILGALPRGEALPYWILACVTLGGAVFANSNETLWNEVDFYPILGIIGAHIAFVVVVMAQIRVFLKKISKNAPDDFRAVRSSHEARAAAYIMLAVASLFLPDTSEKLASPLVRCVSLFGIVILVYPLSRVLDKALSAFYGRASGVTRTGALALAPAIVAVLIPFGVVAGLANQPVGVSLFSNGGGQGPARAGKKSPNVIILLIDMVRADHLSCYGYHRETTPNIDEYAAGGLMFSNARTQASWTLPSTATLLSGLYPSTHGATGVFSSLSSEAETMAEVFSRNGYSTAAVVGNPVVGKSYNVNQGFDYYCDDIMSYTYLLLARRNACLLSKSINAADSARLLFSNERPDVFNTPDIDNYNLLFRPDEVNCEKLNAGALKWVKKNLDGPFFLYIHYLDVHGPFIDPRPFEDKSFRNRVDERMNLYDGALRYTDEQIGLFVEELDRLGVLDDSILIITSDHGEEFGEHGGRTHGYNLFDEQLRIPLIFLRTPAFPVTKTTSAPVGLIDVMPTLIDHLELDSPGVLEYGASFADLFHDDRSFEAPECQYAETELGDLYRSVIYKDRWKYIVVDEPDLQEEWLFDLSKDRLERENLIHDRPDIASELRGKLNEAFSDYESSAFAAKTFRPDKAMRRALRGLGYIE